MILNCYDTGTYVEVLLLASLQFNVTKKIYKLMLVFKYHCICVLSNVGCESLVLIAHAK